jgi:hypothetical protein
MHPRTLILGKFVAGLLLSCLPLAHAQQPMSLASATGGAQGTLTVTASVVGSVGLVIGRGGEQRIVIANAADTADNVSRLQFVSLQRVSLQPVSMARPAPSARAHAKNQPAEIRKETVHR